MRPFFISVNLKVQNVRGDSLPQATQNDVPDRQYKFAMVI